MERRSQQRRIVQLHGVLHREGHTPLKVSTIDVGNDGASCASAASVPPSSQCKLELALPHSTGGFRTVSVDAHVIHCVFTRAHGVKVGLHFDGTSRDALAALERCILNATPAR